MPANLVHLKTLPKQLRNKNSNQKTFFLKEERKNNKVSPTSPPQKYISARKLPWSFHSNGFPNGSGVKNPPAMPWSTACQASQSITNSRSIPKLVSIELVMPSSHLILCCPLPLLPSIFPSNRVFANESALRIRWPMYWSFSFNISPYNEHPGLISFRMDWLDLLAVQGTLKSHFQHHSSKASFLRRSALVAQMGKASACNVGDLDSIPGSGRAPGEGSGNPL